ncbi:hypothetical protein A9Q84_10930 [Halobacteriovorax marinus]|uniref:Secreted protein n=1 Tax=Halobacteriovorax marinus TaxID=97084 RepID=A0A1Y5F7I7_9BACT|nr:hypothetical protein A9Q84_10930 [Halobacteriovorax marinus]
MKIIVLLLTLVTSLSSVSANSSELKSFDYYSNLSCSEMLNSQSDDLFIQFSAREIKEDLGEDFCSKVRTTEDQDDIEVSLNREIEEGESESVSPVQYGRLIDSLYEYYLSIQ